MAEDVKVSNPFSGSGPIEKNDTGNERAFLDEGLDDEPEVKSKKESKSKSNSSDDEADSEESDDSDETENANTDDVSEDGDDDKSEEEDGETSDDEGLSEEEQSVLESANLYKELKKSNPDIFKKHPELKGVIFREHEYTSRFPTIQEADTALERSETFAVFENDILSGKSDKLLATIEKVDPDILSNFVENFLPNVEKLRGGKDLYFDAVAPAIKRLCQVAFNSNDPNVKNSAGHIHRLVFGNLDLEAPYKDKPKVDPDRVKFEEEKKQFETKQYFDFHKETSTAAINSLTRTIAKRFEGSDFSPLMVNKLTDEIMNRIGESLSKDRRHSSNMDSMWKAARSGGYGNTFKTRIINAYLARAKALVPPVSAKVLSEAKGGKIKTGNKSDVKRVTPTNRSTNNAPNKSGAKKPDWSKMSERDFLDA